MIAWIAQVQAPPTEGISSSMFLPLFLGAVIYVVLSVVGTVLENREDSRGPTVSDIAFAVLVLMGIYTAVLLIIALASQFDLIVDMVEIVAIMIAFFTLLILILFAVSALFGLIGRITRRRKRVTT